MNPAVNDNTPEMGWLDSRSEDFNTAYRLWEAYRGKRLAEAQANGWKPCPPSFYFDHWPNLTRAQEASALLLMFEEYPEEVFHLQAAMRRAHREQTITRVKWRPTD